MNIRRLAYIVCVVITLGSTTFAGIGTITGVESGTWNDDRTVVVVGRLTSIRGDRQDEYRVAKFGPLLCLAGLFDPTATASLDVRFYIGDQSSSNSYPGPTDDSLVLVVMRLSVELKEGPTNIIVSDWCTFMPDRAGLVVLKGLDDPRLRETILRLREARAKAAAATRPTTKPAE